MFDDNMKKHTKRNIIDFSGALQNILGKNNFVVDEYNGFD